MRMMLMTKALEREFELRGDQDIKDPIVVTKFFTPWTYWTWYAIAFDPESRNFFGLVEGHERELGYFNLDELESLRGPGGLKIERDLWWEPTPLSKIKSH